MGVSWQKSITLILQDELHSQTCQGCLLVFDNDMPRQTIDFIKCLALPSVNCREVQSAYGTCWLEVEPPAYLAALRCAGRTFQAFTLVRLLKRTQPAWHGVSITLSNLLRYHNRILWALGPHSHYTTIRTTTLLLHKYSSKPWLINTILCGLMWR